MSDTRRFMPQLVTGLPGQRTSPGVAMVEVTDGGFGWVDLSVHERALAAEARWSALEAVARAERDAARDQLAAKDAEIAELRAKYEAVVFKYDAAVEKSIALMQERDEARECVGRLWPLARRVIRDAPDELPEKPADALGHEAQVEWAQDIALCFAVNDLRAALAATPEHLR